MFQNLAARPSRGDIPKTDCLVEAARQHGLAVRAESDRAYFILVSQQRRSRPT